MMSIKHLYTFLLILIISAKVVYAQQIPNYNQYYNNLYLINPAFAGEKGYLSTSLLFRQQWTGIEGAPLTGYLNAHRPITNKMSLGANLTYDQTNIFRSSSMGFTFAYKVPIADSTHYLKFGISGGFDWASIDISGIEINDPALTNLINNYFAPKADFGINYRFKDLKLGFALPALFKRKVAPATNAQNLKFGQFQEYLFHGSYLFTITPGMLMLEPHLLFRIRDNLPSQAEALAVFHIKDMFRVGGGYRTQYGPFFFVGLNLNNEFFQLGYAYDPPIGQLSRYTKGSHEIQLSFRIGDPYKFKPKPKDTTYTETLEDIIKASEAVRRKIDSLNKIAESIAKEQQQQQEDTSAVVEIEAPVIVVKGKGKEKHVLELDESNYVVAGVFAKYANASNFTKQLNKQNLNAQFGFNSQNQLFYIYIHQSKDLREARSLRDQIRENASAYDDPKIIEQLSKAWVLSVIE